MKNLAIALVSLILLASCGSIPKMESNWAKKPFEANGSTKEWNEEFAALTEEKLLIGVKNDQENLYICLRTNDRDNIKKILANGLTLWINDKDSKNKNFGVHYPIGMLNRRDGAKKMQKHNNDSEMAPNEEMRPPDGGEMEGAPPAPPDGDAQSEKTTDANSKDKAKRPMRSMLFKDNIQFAEMEFLKDEGKDVQFAMTDEAKKKYNYKMLVSNSAEGLVYQIVVPFKSELGSFLGNKEKLVTIGLETGENKIPDGAIRHKGGRDGMEGGMMGGGMSSGMGGGGMMGGGGGRGGRGGMRGGGNPDEESSSSNSTDPLNLWISVKLAEPK